MRPQSSLAPFFLGRTKLVPPSRLASLPRSRKLTNRTFSPQAPPSRRPGASSALIALGAGASAFFLYCYYYYQSDSSQLGGGPPTIDGQTRTLGPIYHAGAFAHRHSFSEWTILDRERVGPDSSLITLVRRERVRPPSNDNDNDNDKHHAIRAALVDSFVAETRLEPTDPAVLARFGTQTVLDALFAGAMWSVEVKQPQLQVAREYTPIPPLAGADGDGDGDSAYPARPAAAAAGDYELLTVQLFVRNYGPVGGEVSGYLHRLPVGARVELRGPRVEAVLPSTEAAPADIVFLAAGTGIAPAIQLAHVLWAQTGRLQHQQQSGAGSGANKAGAARISLFWSTRTGEEASDWYRSSRPRPTFAGWLRSWLPGSLSATAQVVDVRPGTEEERLQKLNALTARLQRLQRAYPDLSVQVFTSPDRVSARDVQQALSTPPSDRSIIICGPDRYTSYWAGPDGGKGGHVGERAALPSGALSRLARGAGAQLGPARTIPPVEELRRYRRYDSFGRELPGETRGIVEIHAGSRHAHAGDPAWVVERMDSE